MLSSLQFIQDISWEEVFGRWQKQEGSREEWTECATKVKKWSNWENWRRFASEAFQASQRPWKLYTITKPNEVIPQFLVGPFRGWQAYFEKKNIHTFQDLIEKHYDTLSMNTKIVQIMKNFPQPTEMIGIFIEDEEKMVCFEGTHRACALTLSKTQNTPLSFTHNPSIAVTCFSSEERVLLDQMLERGTHK